MKTEVNRTKKMRTYCLVADWDPKPDFKLGSRDIEGKLTYLGSKVWRNPHMEMIEKEIPVPGPDEVLIEVPVIGKPRPQQDQHDNNNLKVSFFILA